ncbi:MAG TPA: hypothetical protein VF723_05005 [Pyrinomonadaceae bacterium]|jgi:hypothetical protein
MNAPNPWFFLLAGYLFTVMIETPVLLIGLSSRHPFRRRLFAGLWLTACTYPIVIIVLPALFAGASRGLYLWVAEIFAPVAECALFRLAFGERSERGRASMWRDFAAIILANLASFGLGEVMNAYEWFGLLG